MLLSRFLPVTVCFCWLVSTACLPAEESLKVEQPAPEKGYSPERPDYLHFKEVLITRKSKYSLDFEIVLQGKIPSRLDRNEGVRYKIYVDLADLKTDTTEKTIGDFNSDLIIAVFQNPRTSRFDSWSNSVRFQNTIYDVKITKLRASDDRISFEARCELFGMAEAMRFTASTGRLFIKKGEESTHDNGVQDTKVFDVPIRQGGLAPGLK